MSNIVDTPSVNETLAELMANAIMYRRRYSAGQEIKWSFASSVNINDLNNSLTSASIDILKYFKAANTGGIFTPFPTGEIQRERDASPEIFSLFSQVANLKFTYVADPAQADIRLGYASLVNAGGVALERIKGVTH